MSTVNAVNCNITSQDVNASQLATTTLIIHRHKYINCRFHDSMFSGLILTM